VRNAFNAFTADLRRYPGNEDAAERFRDGGLPCVNAGDADGLRRLIEAFR
jgi:hypothetical protein